MRVAIDCRYVRERPSGIGAYVQALVDRVPSLARHDRFDLWVDPRARRPLSTSLNVREHVVRAPPNGLRTLTAPARLADLGGTDVLHAPFNILGRGVPCATVVTVHDLMWLDAPALAENPSALTPLKAAFYRDGILRALREATRLVAISRATADAIGCYAPEARDKTEVIPHGIESCFVPPADREAADHDARALLGIDGPYLLVVGQNTPSKNHDAVRAAFVAADLDPRVRLVMLQRLYRREHADPRVVYPERLAHGELLRVLQGATALVQFSRYEGFGMPALEALACGTPVVASDIAPLVEVLGGAAVHVPLRVPDLSRALERVVRDAALRADLSARGVERARAFSWDRCAPPPRALPGRLLARGYRRARGPAQLARASRRAVHRLSALVYIRCGWEKPRRDAKDAKRWQCTCTWSQTSAAKTFWPWPLLRPAVPAGAPGGLRRTDLPAAGTPQHVDCLRAIGTPAHDSDPDHLRRAAGHGDRAHRRPVLGRDGALAQRRGHGLRRLPADLRRRDLGAHAARHRVAQRGHASARAARHQPGRELRSGHALRLGRADAEHQRDRRLRHGRDPACQV